MIQARTRSHELVAVASFLFIVSLCSCVSRFAVDAFVLNHIETTRSCSFRSWYPRAATLPTTTNIQLLSLYLENDLVSIRTSSSSSLAEDYDYDDNKGGVYLHVVRSDGTLSPLCAHEDDNPTDLYVDPRRPDRLDVDDDAVLAAYGEGWYGQRVVPSLGGGLGYGAEADDVWIVDEDVLDAIVKDGATIPTLDVGIAHGEKARGGAV